MVQNNLNQVFFSSRIGPLFGQRSIGHSSLNPPTCCLYAVTSHSENNNTKKTFKIITVKLLPFNSNELHLFLLSICWHENEEVGGIKTKLHFKKLLLILKTQTKRSCLDTSFAPFILIQTRSTYVVLFRGLKFRHTK